MKAQPTHWHGCPDPTPLALSAVLLALAAGCGTTRMSDSTRTATEQLLISSAVDRSVSQFDFTNLAGKRVYFDAQYLDGTVDKGYVVSSLRQHLLASGCLLQEDRKQATYVVEARSGAVGTDHSSVLVGVPQMTVPAVVPGQPSQIPEIPLAKKNDQKGVAKLAVFAYNRLTGERVWQSGVVDSQSSSKDVWVLGTGPFQKGSIRSRTTFAGEAIPSPFGPHETEHARAPVVRVTEGTAWAERQPPPVAADDPFDHLGTGSLSRFALAAYVRSRLEDAPHDAGVVQASASSAAPAEPGRLPALPAVPPPPDVVNDMLTDPTHRRGSGDATQPARADEGSKPGG